MTEHFERLDVDLTASAKNELYISPSLPIVHIAGETTRTSMLSVEVANDCEYGGSSRTFAELVIVRCILHARAMAVG